MLTTGQGMVDRHGDRQWYLPQSQGIATIFPKCGREYPCDDVNIVVFVAKQFRSVIFAVVHWHNLQPDERMRRADGQP